MLLCNKCESSFTSHVIGTVHCGFKILQYLRWTVFNDMLSVYTSGCNYP